MIRYTITAEEPPGLEASVGGTHGAILFPERFGVEPASIGRLRERIARGMQEYIDQMIMTGAAPWQRTTGRRS